MPSTLFHQMFFKNLTVIALVMVTSFGKAQNYPYPESMMPLMTEYRDCILSNPDSCLELRDEVFAQAEAIKRYDIIAKCYLLQGIGYAYRNDLANAITTFMQCESIAEKLEPNDNLINARNNIANMYISQGDSVRAMKYFEKGLEASEAMNSMVWILNTKTQMLALLVNDADDPTTVKLMNELRADEDSMNLNMKAYYYLLLAHIYRDREQYDSALFYSRASLDIYSNDGDQIGIVSSNYEIGKSNYFLGNLDASINFCSEGEKLANELDMALWKSQNCECLWLAYKKKGNADKALYYLEKKNEYEEEVTNDERIRDLTALEVSAEFEKVRLRDSIQVAENQKVVEKEREIEVNKAKTKVQFLVIGLCSFVIILFLLVRQVRNKKRDNAIMKDQRDVLELKQTEILDSINYAQRIQRAIFPKNSDIKSLGQDYFVYFKPKDVVSGDFYWFYRKKLSSGKEVSFFAVADCTGHGVPGALVSVLCSGALNRTVKELDTTDPALILNEVNQSIQEAFETDNEEISDGMDIALVSRVSGANEIQFAGANNSLFLASNKLHTKGDQIVSNVVDVVHFHEFKGDRQPVGRHHSQVSFTSQTIEIAPNDIAYLTSDGYADQFGGAELEIDKKSGKKFKKKSLKNLFLEISVLSIPEQHNLLKKTHENWMEGFEQTDDVCVVGIKF